MTTTRDSLSLIAEGIAIDPAMISDVSGLDFDDSVAFGGFDILENEPIFQETQDNWSFNPTPPEPGLYSTPLSWDPPQAHSLSQSQVPTQSIFRPTMNTLTPAQREKLRNIAMPDHLRFQNSPESSNSIHKSDTASPDHQDSTRKRKSSDEPEEDDFDEDGVHPPVKKTAHNMIEKRYRTNLNDKIAALRDSVPSLRVMSKNARGEDASADREDLQGLTPAHKLNKATVLAKATEYIRHLEKRNKRLQEDNSAMKARIHAFEKLFMSGSMGINSSPPTMAYGYPQQENFMSPNGQMTPGVSPQGMIEVPEDIRRMNAQTMMQNQQIYHPQEQYPHRTNAPPAPNGWAGNGYFGKMMVGSLAGLMILEGFTESEQEGDEPSARGLFSLPVQMARTISRSLTAPFSFDALGYNASSSQMFLGCKVILILLALLYVLIPSVFVKKSASANDKVSSSSPIAAPSLASSIQVRRQAWLTAIQTVWVPRHNFVLEAAAIVLKIAKLSLRNAVGWYGFAMLTGITEQQEAARIKAWSIALDAQLGGGDVEISKGRLFLTLLASCTLPNTSARLMMQALHIRVLLWELGYNGINANSILHDLAMKLARWKWNEAQKEELLQKLVLDPVADFTSEALAPHLAALLKQDCDEVLNDCVAQRAYNLAWNLPTTYKAQQSSDGMDSVVSDFAIRSPLDAVAAWYSSLTLQSVLSLSLDANANQDDIISKLAIVYGTAPDGSTAQARALVARAILLNEGRGAHIAEAVDILTLADAQSKSSDESHSSPFVNSTLSLATLPDLKLALDFATTCAHLQRTPVSENAYRRINNYSRPDQLTLLSFTAAYKLMIAIDAKREAAEVCERVLEGLAARLRIWAGGMESVGVGLELLSKEVAIERCNDVSKRCIGFSADDDGYESMSLDDEGTDGC